MSPRVPLFHADHGPGFGERFAEAIDGTREPLLFVRWTEALKGVAGGWYDPADERINVECVRLLNQLYMRDIGVPEEAP